MKYLYLSILTFVLFGLSISQNWAQSEQPKLTIGCISDLHCEDEGGSSISKSPYALRTSVTTTLSKMGSTENLDAIMVGGDITSKQGVGETNWKATRDLLADELKAAFGNKEKPVYIITGNHEFQASFSSTGKAQLNSGDYYTVPMSTFTGTLTNKSANEVTANPGECYYETLSSGSFSDSKHVAAYHYQQNGIDIIGINTSSIQFNTSTGPWYYSDGQVNWVAKKLEKITATNKYKLILVEIHIPFSDNNNGDSKHGMDDGIGSTGTLKSTFAKYPNLIMFFGHDHSSSKAYISKNTSERITHYNAKGEKMNMTSTSSHKGGSFSSVFMGSMNYRDYQDLYQALMVYIYDDRVELHMKDYSTSKDAYPSGVSATLNPYTIYLSDGTEPEPEPESGSFLIKNNANGTYLNASSDGLSLSSTKQGWDITSLGSSLFRVITTSGSKSYNICGMSGNNNIRVTSDHTTDNDEKYNCYFYEINNPDADPVEGTLASEISAGKYYFIDTQYKSGTHYILGNTAGTKGSDGTTLKGQSVSPSSNKISRSKSDAANCIYYIEAPITYNYFGKVTATATTGGQVIVDAYPTASSEFAASSVKSWGAETNSEEKTWYFHAQANSGYEFMAWAEDEAGKKAVSKDADFQIKVTATSDNKSNPTAKQYYAIFRKVESGATINGYYLMNMGNSNYLDGTPSSTKNEAKFAFSSTEQVWNIEPSTDNYFRITLTKNGVTSNIYHGYYNSSSNYKFKLYNTPTEDGWKYNCFLYKINETDIEKSSITATKVTDSKITSGYYFIGSTNNDDNHSNLTVNIMGNETSTSSKLVALSKENMSSSKESDATITVSVSNIKNYIYQIIDPNAKAETVEVTVSSAGYATYCSDKDLVVPADETVFGAKSNGNVVSLIPVKEGDVIKAGEGFIIKSTPGTVTFNISKEAGEEIDGNDLLGTTEYESFTQGTIYLLGQDNGSMAFMLNNGSYLLAPNKAYLNKSANAKQVLYISEDIDDATAINSMSGNIDNAKMYNLNGIQVNKNYKGIVIKDGKKYLLK